jgi:hypothetical protein
MFSSFIYGVTDYVIGQLENITIILVGQLVVNYIIG